MTLHPALLQQGGTRQLQAWLTGNSMKSVFHSCPVQMKGWLKQAVRVALVTLETAAHGNDEVMECNAWIFCCCRSRRLLGRGRIGKFELTRVFDSFCSRNVDELLKEVEAESSHSSTARVSREMTAEQKAKMVCHRLHFPTFCCQDFFALQLVKTILPSIRFVNNGGQRLWATCSGQPLTVTFPEQFSASGDQNIVSPGR